MICKNIKCFFFTELNAFWLLITDIIIIIFWSTLLILLLLLFFGQLILF